ncbi:MAG: hypothetical protein ABIZ57_08170 [Candidatus Limnocylindria bacterium]
MGQLLAFCGWLAWQVGRPFRATPLRRFGHVPVTAVAVVLVVLAAVPVVMPLFDPQPEDVTVQQIFDGATTHPNGWIRLRGRITPLTESPTGIPGSYALLVDAENALRAVVVQSQEDLEAQASTAITGTLTPRGASVVEELPIEARVAGTPPRVAPDRIVVLDAAPTPPRSVLWPIAIPPILLAGVLLIGARVGYPIFRPTFDIDVLARPLAPGERIPSAYGGRIGSNRAELADPAGVLLLVRRGPNGNLLTAQPLAEGDAPAPQPVTIGGSWTNGRIGSVHTARETVAALHVRSELVDATFLFARSAERDRVAALVAVER